MLLCSGLEIAIAHVREAECPFAFDDQLDLPEFSLKHVDRSLDLVNLKGLQSAEQGNRLCKFVGVLDKRPLAYQFGDWCEVTLTPSKP